MTHSRAEVNPERAQDGTLYTYVKRKAGRHKLIWTFSLNRAKALELRAFIQSYHSSRVQVEDHNSVKWQGNLTNNPFEFSTPGRGRTPATPIDVSAEKQVVTLEFEGHKI